MTPITLGLALLTNSRAATIEVPDDFATAAGAVAAAANGDVIQFNALVNENFTVVNKTLTFRASVFEAGWLGTMTVTGAGANVTIDGMTLRGGATVTDSILIQAGIFCAGQTPSAVVITAGALTVSNSEMTCYSNGAIEASNADLTVDNTIFRYNYAGDSFVESGRAIHQVGGDLLVDGGTFEFNAGVLDGGAVYSQGANTDVLNSRFYANSTSLGGGGALYIASDTVNVDANEFHNNYNLIWYIPGIIISDPNDLLGVSDEVAGLTVGIGDGAGLYLEDPPLAASTSVRVHDNTFCGNLADRGAGMFIDDVAGVDVINNRFAENWSMHEGGGLYVTAQTAWGPNEEATITNNTFLLNTAGKIPPPYPELITEIGAGGGAALVGTIIDFRNNILAKTEFGGGILGVDGPDYTIGDLIGMDFNILYNNCDESCDADDPNTWQNFTGDINQIALPATNIQLDPFPLYFGAGDFNCFPDAFYPTWDSPAVRSGDPSLPNVWSAPFSDIGAYGGPEANVLDRDGDAFENIYDCNDEVGSGEGVFPGAPEVCDYLDNDCDGLIDEGFDTTWYPDNDNDAYGDLLTAQPLITCDTPPGYVLNRTDCDDNNPDINPSNPEICDGKDNDCDFAADGGLPFFPIWNDLDSDGYGAGEQFNGCEAQDGNTGFYVIEVPGEDPVLHTAGYVPNSTDCNDFNQNVSPAAAEVCDNVDNNCNGLVDDAQEGGTRYYTDSDGDGFGEGAEGVLACTPPDVNSVELGGDCDDGDPGISPGEPEICDGIDNNCDALVDQEADNAPLLYEDLDNDGYGNPSTARRDCNPGPTYTADNGDDCDDNDPAQGPCGQCACQAAPGPESLGAFGALVVLALVGRRRR